MGEPLATSADKPDHDEGEPGGWLSSILAQVLIQETVSNVNDRFKMASDAIDQEIEVRWKLCPVRFASALDYRQHLCCFEQALLEEEEALNKAAEDEHFEVNAELSRVTLLVTSFKDQVEQYLSSC